MPFWRTWGGHAVRLERRWLRRSLWVGIDNTAVEQEVLEKASCIVATSPQEKEALREDNAGFYEVVWQTPQSIDELKQVADIVAEAHRGIDDDEFSRDFEALQQLKNIDLSQLGDEDG